MTRHKISNIMIGHTLTLEPHHEGWVLEILNSVIADSTHIPIGIRSRETREGLVITQAQGDAPRARIIGQSTSRDIIPRRHQAVEGQYLGYRYLLTTASHACYLTYLKLPVKASYLTMLKRTASSNKN